MPRRRAAGVAALLLAALSLLLADAPARAEPREVTQRRQAERKHFSDAEIADGLFRVAFGAEFHVAGRVDRIRKYDGPVRVFIDRRGGPDRGAQIAAVVADIGRHIRHLDIALVNEREAANVIVTVVPDRRFRRTLAELFGREKTQALRKVLDPQCLSGFRKDDDYRIQHSDVVLVGDVDAFTFLDCAYEELLQALGPINDTDKVPWTMFNDDVRMGFFDVYDQHLLNILYDPRVRPGMTAPEVRALLPQVLPDVREWVSRAKTGAVLH
ncbi:MAG: DUF2927 domain-containing protein [Xanthobacteraceae bacterium]|nr:MAG: DUF2927 domain-containing protein [Xanthobacteraceae bacterium]